MDETKYDIPIGIPEFYKGKSVFITGFTGYLGQLLVEKLLYSCREIDKIYILVRGKKGLSPQERVKTVVNSRSFIRIQQEVPDFLNSKIVVISGDLLADKLGLSQEDEETLRNNVSIIMHSAATVRFDEPLNVAFQMNTLGTKRIVDLALTMPLLICLTYISSAYSNCDTIHIKEEIMPPKADWRKTQEIFEKIDLGIVETLHKKYIGDMPNTYTFTKSLSEHMINDYRDRLPVVIVRPSIIFTSYKEPVVGWTGNKSGPTGIMMGYLVGLLRCNYMDLKEKPNCIHSDIAVNSTIVATWVKALTHKPEEKQDTTPLYNVCEPLWYSHTNGQYATIYETSKMVHQINADGINFVSVAFKSTESSFRLHNLYRHVFPAYIIDLLLRLAKKKPLLVAVRRSVFLTCLTVSYFLTRTFKFETKHFDSLTDYIKSEDKEAFSWDFTKIDMNHTYRCCYSEVKKHFLKPIFDDIETNRKRLKMLYLVDRTAVAIVYTLIGLIIYKFSIPQVLISAVISFFALQ